jgi:hypothetical protein
VSSDGTQEQETTVESTTMTSRLVKSLMMATAISGMAAPAFAEDVTLTIESWRNDDLAIWQDKIIPAFEAKPIPASRWSSRRPRRPNTMPR